MLLQVQLAFIDAVAWVYALLLGAGYRFAYYGTVWADPCGRAARPVRGFAIAAADAGDQRFVAWFYRWHDTPTLETWRAACLYAGRGAAPAHRLARAGALVHVDLDIRAGTLATGAGAAKAARRIGIRGLQMEQLIRD